MNKIKKFNFAIVVLLVACFTAAAEMQNIVDGVNAFNGLEGRAICGVQKGFNWARIKEISPDEKNGVIEIKIGGKTKTWQIARTRTCLKSCLPDCNNHEGYDVFEITSSGVRLSFAKLDDDDEVVKFIISDALEEFCCEWLILVSKSIGVESMGTYGEFWKSMGLKVVSEEINPCGMNVIKIADFSGKIIYTIGYYKLFMCCVKGDCDLSEVPLRNNNNWREQPWRAAGFTVNGFLMGIDFQLEESQKVAKHDYECVYGYLMNRFDGKVVYCSDFGGEELIKHIKPRLLTEEDKVKILMNRVSLVDILRKTGLTDDEIANCFGFTVNQVISNLVQAVRNSTTRL